MDTDGHGFCVFIRVYPCLSVVNLFWLRLGRAAPYRGLPTRHNTSGETTTSATQQTRLSALQPPQRTPVVLCAAGSARMGRWDRPDVYKSVPNVLSMAHEPPLPSPVLPSV